ncbi:hypothetical protein [Bradyrhizobium sp. NP1]|uniref:hypothetical protein n=1 Tax=Bradyrhizobium sp. NP1 TaxID=3049772 RepID=UPI0025A539CC|nr:hypothetical protein [Bradyrhizobium sp. NP1]WJR76459.1 hypothetical protein QOU61_27400 [Bradyrhizobium sp. NP1]
MSQKALAIVCALFIVPLSDGTRASAEPDVDWPSWMPQPGPGEDAVVVRRNAFMNKLAEARNNRVTIVKFDNDLEANCPTLTSLFFSAGDRLELLTPNLSLNDAAGTTVYLDGSNSDGKRADFFVQNAACRYVLTVKRYDRDGDAEKEVQARDIPKINKDWVFKPPPAGKRDDRIGFGETIAPFDNPSKPLNFTGIAFFAPTTLTIYLANVEKDLTIASESNLLTHTYKVDIGNAQAALRISISKELYSNGQWVTAYGR